MPKLPSLKPREVGKILNRAGFIFVHQEGSHRTYRSSNLSKYVTVPFHTKDIPTGTLISIIKQSGLTKDEFIKLRKKKK